MQTALATPRTKTKATIIPLIDKEYTETVHVTPAMATKWLNANVVNRVLRNWWVEELARRIARGEWMLTHQGIAFDRKGNLIDGQHRLWAIVESDTPIDLRVTYGADPATFAVLDCGFKRTLGDQTGESKHVTEVANRIARFMTHRAVTSKEILPYIRAFKAEVEKLHAACGSSRRGLSAATVRAAAAIRMRMHPELTDYICDNYRNMVLMHLSEAPPVFSALARALDHGAREDGIIVRAFRAFDIKSAQNTKIQVKDFDSDREVIRNIVAGYLAVDAM